MTKHRLQLEDDYEFLAYGISCHLKDYRIAWLINSAVHLNFIRGNMQIMGKNGVSQDFARYLHNDEDNRLKYVLIANQNDEVHLLKEFKEYDYFLLIEGYIDIFNADLFESNLQKVEGIQFVADMDPDDFKRLQYNIFED
jgi:hypothetical protein